MNLEREVIGLNYIYPTVDLMLDNSHLGIEYFLKGAVSQPNMSMVLKTRLNSPS